MPPLSSRSTSYLLEFVWSLGFFQIILGMQFVKLCSKVEKAFTEQTYSKITTSIKCVICCYIRFTDHFKVWIQILLLTGILENKLFFPIFTVV